MCNVSTRSLMMVLLAGGFALLASGCESLPNPQTSSPAPSASPVSVKAATVQPSAQPSPTTTQKANPPSPKAQALLNLPPGVDPYEQALDMAAGAKAISESAQSRDDWTLAASNWQEAIQLLQAVPSSDRNYGQAQQRLKQFKNSLTVAQRQAAPPAKPKAAPGPVLNPAFFSLPIKSRISGIPVVELTFNGKHQADMLLDTGASSTLITLETAHALNLQPIGMAKSTIANGDVVEFYVAQVSSVVGGGRIMKNVNVKIAPPSLEIGLLGQDFYWNYDMTIKENVVEFRRRREVNML